MRKDLIHYKHPVFDYHACGMGDVRLIKMTEDIVQVNCKRCLSTKAGKKAREGMSDIKD